VTVYYIRALHKSELVLSYRLRHDAYAELGYLPPSPSGLEIDQYDVCAVPFGAFVDGQIVGALRMIRPARDPRYGDQVDELLTTLGDPEIARRVLKPRQRLPALANDLRLLKDPVAELSRFVVRPAHRRSGLARCLAALALATAAQETHPDPAVLIASCLAKHVKPYAEYGFIPIVDAGLRFNNDVGQVGATVICQTDILPTAIRDVVDDLRRSLADGSSTHAHGLVEDARVLYQFHQEQKINP